jgi:hypothetical protein
MNADLENGTPGDPDLSTRVVSSMLRKIEQKYALLFATADQEWQARFAGREASDTCVTISIHPSHTPRVLVPFTPPASPSESNTHGS